MWTQKLLGSDVYHLVSAFIIYSVMGWIVESVYMSFCNRKLTNRGFGRGPFCPIYGFGGVVGYLLLHPLKGNLPLLYLTGAILATVFEFLVGKLLLRLFGEAWWDYHGKPCNYKGLICLESTIAWGFYAVFIISFLHRRILGFIDTYDFRIGTKICVIILIGVGVDYLLRIRKLTVNQENGLQRTKNRVIERYQSFKARWL